MPIVLERLQTLKVLDVVARHVVTVPDHATLGEAATLLVEHGISGAPVVDPAGRCVGILTANDFVRHEASACLERGGGPTSHRVEISGPQGALHLTDVCDDRVATHMHGALQTIRADAPLLLAARMMCAEHIHRLIVIDAEGRPTGVVTTLDLVAAVLNALDEAFPQAKSL